MSGDLLPLFPLNVVLFPGTPLPLHIFEPRYRQMTRECLDEKREFGVVLARKEGIAAVGCSAEIVKLVKQYEDGRSDILTIGRRRFRVGEVFDDKPYYQGRVEFLSEAAGKEDPNTAERLLVFYAEVHRLVYGREGDPVPAEAVSLAYSVAAELPLDVEHKQELLELDSEPERRRMLIERLEAWAEELRRATRAREKAGGNGHGR
ncbi:MAG: LON peptidase substrate-binding domain-containing protein [Candidatus Acidiferrales bacterium]